MIQRQRTENSNMQDTEMEGTIWATYFLNFPTENQRKGRVWYQTCKRILLKEKRKGENLPTRERERERGRVVLSPSTAMARLKLLNGMVVSEKPWRKPLSIVNCGEGDCMITIKFKPEAGGASEFGSECESPRPCKPSPNEYYCMLIYLHFFFLQKVLSKLIGIGLSF